MQVASSRGTPEEELARTLLDRCNRRLTARRTDLLIKRLLDFSGAFALLLLLWPVFVVAALAVSSSRGPVLFRQQREGSYGRCFRILKFRSMKTDTSPSRTSEPLSHGANAVLLKFPGDPRVTRAGRWLRRTSIDELPQLLNVLRGEMSLVGPRPLPPFMLDPYPELRRIRALVRPGVTGLWQLRDRTNNTSAATMLSHDIEYIERFNLRLDLWILLRTIPAVVSGRGAY